MKSHEQNKELEIRAVCNRCGCKDFEKPRRIELTPEKTKVTYIMNCGKCGTPTVRIYERTDFIKLEE